MSTAAEYKTDLKPVWCPGCGDFGVLAAFAQAFARLEIPREDIVMVTGIGCSSRIAGYLKVYGFNAIHGRTLPIATGVKLANPNLTVIAAGGDGDAYSIGMGHIPHAARRNIAITYLVMDNEIYGLTKGQQSPTSPVGIYSSSTPFGTYDQPINPLQMMLAFNATFVAQTFAGDTKHLVDVLIRAIQHRGFAFINCISPCPTYRGGMQIFKEIKARVRNLDEEPGRDLANREIAFGLAASKDFTPIGVLYKKEEKDYGTVLESLKPRGTSPDSQDLDKILKTFIA